MRNIICENGEIEKAILKNITAFEFLCNFREQEKKRNLKIMYKL